MSDLVEVGGELVWDAHYHPVAPRDLFSMTKPVVAALVGIAVEQGRVDLDDEVEPGVSVRHLLTMTRGAVAGFDEIDLLLELPTSWLPTIRGTQRQHPPGETFAYDNGGAHLLGVHVADRLGETLEEFAARELFGPLGITGWTWPKDPDGHSFGFGHLQLYPHDLLAFARMLLHRGRGWAGQLVTVVPRHQLIVVTTGLPGLLSADWQSARDTAVPVLVAAADQVAGGAS